MWTKMQKALDGTDRGWRLTIPTRGDPLGHRTSAYVVPHLKGDWLIVISGEDNIFAPTEEEAKILAETTINLLRRN